MTVQSGKQGTQTTLGEERAERHRDAPRQRLTRAKAIRRESAGKDGGASITPLGNMAIKEEKRKTYL